MDIGSLFLILALAILVGLYIVRPLSGGRKTIPQKDTLQVSPEEHALSALLAERDRVLTSLQELDFDYLLGKIPEEDYPEQRQALLQRGADILRQLDQVQTGRSEPLAEERLEAILTERRQAQAIIGNNGKNGKSRPPDDAVEALIATRRRSRQEKAAGFCPKCGGPVQQTDRFCPKCGVAVKL